MLSVYPKVLVVELSKLPEPLLILKAQLLVDTPDVLISEFFQNIATLIPLHLDQLHYLLRGQLSLVSSHIN